MTRNCSRSITFIVVFFFFFFSKCKCHFEWHIFSSYVLLPCITGDNDTTTSRRLFPQGSCGLCYHCGQRGMLLHCTPYVTIFWIKFPFVPMKTLCHCQRTTALDKRSIQGPVVQSVISLTSPLVVKMLTVQVCTISNSLVFLLKKCE